MSNSSKSNVLVIGGPPRAELLPPEVAQGVKARALRRLLAVFIILSIAVVALAVGGAAVGSGASAQILAAETERGNQLILEQGKYAEVRQITALIGKAEEGLVLGSLTEISWKAYFSQIQGSLPKGTVVTNFHAETSTPTMPFAQPTVPLQGERIGELRFTATSKTLPDIEEWLNALSTVTGFVDASPGSIALDEEGTYVVNITMHINKDALNHKFDPVEPGTEETTEQG
ncbi:MAG: hypothetical protein ACOH1T_10915 [Microbacteriaceae bacterium]